jgi:hypothetical protein
MGYFASSQIGENNMTNDTQFVSPLRQRMIDDMTMRKLSPKTQSAYVCAITKLACYLGRSPDSATIPRAAELTTNNSDSQWPDMYLEFNILQLVTTT